MRKSFLDQVAEAEALRQEQMEEVEKLETGVKLGTTGRPLSPFYTIPLVQSDVGARYDIMPPESLKAMLTLHREGTDEGDMWIRAVDLDQVELIQEAINSLSRAAHISNLLLKNALLLTYKDIVPDLLHALVYVQCLLVVSPGDIKEEYAKDIVTEVLALCSMYYKPYISATGLKIIAEVMEFGAGVRGYPEGGWLPDKPDNYLWFVKSNINHAMAHLVGFYNWLLYNEAGKDKEVDENHLTHALCRTYFAIGCSLDFV
jgi:hypothetical protein